MFKYIEEAIEVLIDSEDVSINDRALFTSFIRQIKSKKLGLTDRQYELAVLKLEKYKHYVDIPNPALLDTMYPIRTLDRLQTVSIQEIDDEEFIELKYVFNNKMISVVKEIDKWFCRSKKRESKHYYECNDQSLYHIISALKEKQFTIEPQLLDRYNKLKFFYENKSSYVPGIYNNQIKNLPQEAIDSMINEFGEPSSSNMFLYKDSRYNLGLVHFDEEAVHDNQIVQLICNRKSRCVKIPQTIPFSELSFALDILNRPIRYVHQSGDLRESDLLTKIKNELNTIEIGQLDIKRSFIYRVQPEHNLEPGSVLVTTVQSEAFILKKYKDADLIIQLERRPTTSIEKRS